MSFAKGVMLGGLVTASVMWMYSETMGKDSKKKSLNRWNFKINNKTNKKAESKLLKKFNNLGSFLCEK